MRLYNSSLDGLIENYRKDKIVAKFINMDPWRFDRAELRWRADHLVACDLRAINNATRKLVWC